MSSIWLNGSFIDEADASISLRDTGLLHAAGVFTTMRSYHGRVFRIAEHLQRTRNSCEALFVPLQYKDEDLIKASHDLLEMNDLTEARLRLTVTRGHATHDPLHGVHLQPNVFITVTDLEPYPAEFYERGMTVILLDEQKLNPYDIQAAHKTLNYFSRLAGLKSANRRMAGEALWFNVHNYLQCGSISNVFIVKNGALITPPTNEELRDEAVKAATPYPKSNVLPGITRGAIIDAAHSANIPVNFAGISVNDLLEADEVFLTNSIMQVMPVCRIERKVIGADKPGEMTLKLTASYRAMVDEQTQ